MVKRLKKLKVKRDEFDKRHGIFNDEDRKQSKKELLQQEKQQLKKEISMVSQGQ